MDDDRIVRLLEAIRDLGREQGARQRESLELQQQAVATQREAVENQKQAIAMQRLVVRRVIPALLVVLALVVGVVFLRALRML